MKQPIWLMLGFTWVGLSQVSFIQSAMAQRTNPGNPRNNSDTTGVIIAPPITQGNNIGVNIRGNFNRNAEAFSFNDLTGGFGVSPAVINLIPGSAGTGSVRRNSTTDDGGSSALGDSDDSSEITICSSDPCTPNDGAGKAITLNDLAKLIEDDLNQSFDDLVAAEQLERELADQPKRIIKRTSRRDATNCVSPAIEARREFEKKLQNSREFVEQMERLKPENNGW